MRAYNHRRGVSKINLSYRDRQAFFGPLRQRLSGLLGDRRSLYPSNCCDSAGGRLQYLFDWNQSLRKRTDSCAWGPCCLVAAVLDAHLALYACADYHGGIRCSLTVQDGRNWVQDCCCLLCWRAFAVRLACFRLVEPNDGSKSKAMRWIVLRGSGSVVMGAHLTGCGVVAVGYTSRLW